MTFKKRFKGYIRTFECIRERSSFAIIGRIVYDVLCLYYLRFIWTIQRYNLPEGPPFFNPMIESRRSVRYDYIDRKTKDGVYSETKREVKEIIKSEILSMPLGVWVIQISGLLRLCFSCFVGYKEDNNDVTSMKNVLRRVRSKMALEIIASFPYQILWFAVKSEFGEDSQVGRILWSIIFLFNLVPLIRLVVIYRDVYFLRRYVGWIFEVIFLFCSGLIVEGVCTLLWYQLPEWYCGSYHSKTEKFHMIECFDKRCSFFKLKDCCFVRSTWWSTIHYILQPAIIHRKMDLFDIRINKSRETIFVDRVYWINTNSELFYSIQFYVFNSLKQVGLGFIVPQNNLEMIFTIVIVLSGVYYYNWKFVGIISSMAMAQDSSTVERSHQLEMVEDYCKNEEMQSDNRQLVLNFAKMLSVESNVCIFSNTICESLLPEDYQNDLIEETVFKAVVDKIRIFRDLDPHIQLVISYQFKTEYYMAGDIVINEGEIPIGLGIIQKGYIYVIHPDMNQGALVKLGPGDYFGELTLVKGFPSKLLFQTTTNCEIWMLHREHYLRLIKHFPTKMKQNIIINYYDILKIQDCRFHDCLDVRRPKYFAESARRFWKYGSTFNIISDPFIEDLHNLSHKSHIKKRKRFKCEWPMHQGMKGLKMWTYIMGILAIICSAIGLSDLRTVHMGNLGDVGVSDVVWPNNPFAYYRIWVIHTADKGHKFIYSFSLLMTGVCLCDGVLWFMTAISTPYGLVTGLELFKRKINPKYSGFSALVKISTSLWIGLKLIHFKEVINMHVRYRVQILPYIILSLICLIIICHYVVRLEYLLAYFYWIGFRGPKIEEGLCSNLRQEWGETMLQINQNLRQVATEALTNSADLSTIAWNEEDIVKFYFKDLDRVEHYLEVADSASVNVFSTSRVFLSFMINFQYLCTQNWETQLANCSYYQNQMIPYYEFYLRYLLILFSIAMTEGSDVLAYLPSTYGHFWCMVIVTVMGMYVMATINAKMTAHYTANILPLSQIHIKLDCIKGVMQQQNVNCINTQEVIDYLNLCYFGMNRTTMKDQSKLLHSIPHRIRITAQQKNLIKDQSFFSNSMLISHIIESSMYLIFPPKAHLFIAGDLFLGYFIIEKGYCLEIDLLGNVLIRGPGTSIGMASLWLGQHISTAVAHTYLRGFWVDARIFTQALCKCPREFRLFKEAFLALDDFIVSVKTEITTKRNFKFHTKNMESLLKHFLFTNVTKNSNVKEVEKYKMEKQQRVCSLCHILCLERCINAYNNKGFILFVVRLVTQYISTALIFQQSIFLSINYVFGFAVGICDALLITDWFLRVNMYIFKDGVALSDHLILLRHWKKTQVIWDLLLLFPFEILVWPFVTSLNISVKERKALIFVRSIRVLRAVSYQRGVFALKKIFPKRQKTIALISIICALCFIIHALGCIWIAVLCKPGIHEWRAHLNIYHYIRCNNPQWMKKFYIHTNIEVNFQSQTAISDSDHANFYFIRDPTCFNFMELPEESPCSSYRAYFFRYYLTGFQQLTLHEGTTPIWIQTNHVELLNYYVIAVYWASQVVGTLGLGDINSAFTEDLFVNLIGLFVAVFFRSFILCKIVSIRIDFCEDQAAFFRHITAQRAYLKHHGFHKHEISRVMQSEEINFASKCHIVRSERLHLNDFTFCKIFKSAIEDTFRQMGILQKFTEGQLRLLAANVEWQVLPKGELLFRDHQVVSSIVILKEGLLKILSCEEQRRISPSQESVALKIVSMVKGEIDGREGIDQEEENDQMSFLRAGTVLGSSDNYSLEFWTGNVFAYVPCSLFLLKQDVIHSILSTDAGVEFAPVVEALHERVSKTKTSVRRFLRYNRKNLTQKHSRKWRRKTGFLSEQRQKFKYHRTIFHPSESHVNIIFLSTVFFKWIMFIGSVIYCAIINATKRKYKTKNFFAICFNAMQVLSTLITIGEMVFRLHVGYFDKKAGRIVIEPFKVHKRYFGSFLQFLLDVISLLPVWIAVNFNWNFDCTRNDYNILQNIFMRILKSLPLTTIFIQLIRSIQLFQQPRQAQPFNTKILQAKYGIKIFLIITSVLSFLAFLWIVVGCTNSLNMTKCNINGWVEIAYRTKKTTIRDEFDLFMTSLNCIVSVAIGIGFGDVTAHNDMEMVLICLMVISCTFMNCELQSQVLSALYAKVMHDEQNDRDIEALRAGLRSVKPSSGLFDSIMSYVQLWNEGKINPNHSIQNLFVNLNVTLRQEVQYKLCKKFFFKIPALVGINKDMLMYLSLFVNEKIFLPGDYLISRGDLDDHIIYVLSGSAVIKSIKVRQKVSNGSIVKIWRSKIGIKKNVLQYPGIADYDCVAETVVIIYSLPLASLGHVIYSFMDKNTSPKFGRREEQRREPIERRGSFGQSDDKNKMKKIGKDTVMVSFLSPVSSTISENRNKRRSRRMPLRLGFDSVVPEIQPDAAAEISAGAASGTAEDASTMSIRSKQDNDNDLETSSENYRQLSEIFEPTEKLKIIYLAQWYQLEKGLRPKLNPFGRKQLMRFLAWETMNSLVKNRTIPLSDVNETFVPCLNPRRNVARCFVEIRPVTPASQNQLSSEMELSPSEADIGLDSDLHLNLVVTCNSSPSCRAHAHALNCGFNLIGGR